MRFLRRSTSGPDEAISDFWNWWSSARQRIAHAIPTGTLPTLSDEVTSQVRRIHPQLAWEFGPGATAQHSFVVTPEGNAALRPIALRWLHAAPEADATWEYHAARQPGSPMKLGIAGHEIDLAEMRAVTSWDDDRQLLNVRLWHEGFSLLPGQLVGQVMFLFVDNLLGEEDVERWLGSLDALEAPSAGKTPNELRAEVQRHAAERTAERVGARAANGQGWQPRHREHKRRSQAH